MRLEDCLRKLWGTYNGQTSLVGNRLWGRALRESKEADQVSVTESDTRQTEASCHAVTVASRLSYKPHSP